LYTDNNNDNLPDGNAIKTTQTDANGKYLFTGLGEGRYIASMPILPGYQQSPNNTTGGIVGAPKPGCCSLTPDENVDNDNNLVRLVGPNAPGGIVYTNAITLTANQEPTDDGDDANGNLTFDLAECGNSFIGDFVWNDLNGNGIQEANEPGINGVIVTLTFEDGTTATETTHTYNAPNNQNAPQYDGYYDFKNLGPGTYKVTFTTPDGYTPSPANQGGDDAKDSDPVNGGPVTVTIAANQSDFTIDAGFTKPNLPPPPPPSGECPNAAKFDGFENGSFTGGGGSDLYNGLPREGSYQIVQNVDQLGGGGYLNIKPTGNYFLASHTSNNENDRIYYTKIPVTPGQTYTFCVGVTLLKNLGSGANYILGLYVNGNSIATGRVTFDWTQICGTYTAKAGETSIELSLRDPKKGLFFVAIDNICISGPKTGNLRLGNQVWNDRDGDGKRDPNEPGIGGATISLYTDNDGDNMPDGPAISTTQTDIAGKYLFTNLAPGRYIASMPILPGYQQSPNTTTGGIVGAPQPGCCSLDPDANKDNDNNLVRLVGPNAPGGIVYTNAITLTEGGEPTDDGDDANGNLTFDLAECGNSGIGDFVWNDLNGNGIQDAGEPGINGVTVTLTFEDGTVATETTHTYNAANNANAPQYDGYYDFINLGPGTYTVSFATPSGYTPSPANVGDDTKDSDPVNGGPVTLTLAANQSNFTIDAGFTKGTPPPPPSNGCPDNILPGTAGYYGGFEAGSNNITATTGGSDLYNGLPRNGSYQIVQNVDQLGGGGYLDIKPHSGSYFLASHTSNDENDRVWYTKVSVTPGKTYNFCAYVTLLKNLGNGANYILGVYADGQQIGTGRVTFDWTRICGTFTVPAGVTSVELSLRDPKKGLFFVAVDDICVTPGTPTTPPPPPPTTGCPGNLVTDGKGDFGSFEAGSNNFSSKTGSDLYNGLPREGSYQVVKSVNDLGGGGYLDIHAHSGDYFLASHTSNDENDRVWYTKIKVTPGDTYNFCAYVTLLKNLGNGANYILGVYANGQQIGTGRVTFDWTQICGSYTVPAGVTELELSIRDPKKGLFFVAVDDICITGTGKLKLGNYVWNDWDGNGRVDEDEYGIPGMTVRLYRDNDGDNRPDSKTPVATTVSDAKGYYQFTNLIGGKYIASITIPQGYTRSPNTSTQATSPYPDNNVDNDNNLVWPENATAGDDIFTNAITLTPGEEPEDGGYTNNTLDLAICGTLWIGNFVWNDANHNGIQDAGEKGINGISYSVILPDGSTLQRNPTYDNTTYQDREHPSVDPVNGYYDLPRVGPGTYTITFKIPDGYSATLKDVGSDVTDSDIDQNGTVTVVLTTTSNHDVDAGLYQPSTVAGQSSTSETKLASATEEGDVDGASVSEKRCKLKVALEPKDPLCYNNRTGSIISTVTGNTGKVSYLWSNGSTGNNLMNVGEGTYTLKVKDQSSGCEVTSEQVKLNNPEKLVATLKSPEENGYNILCKDGKNGSIDVTVKGGTGAYTYEWNNGATTQDLAGLDAGKYVVTVKDAARCTVQAGITLKEPESKLEVTSVVKQATCNAAGSIEVNVSGGAGHYTYKWSNGATGKKVSGLTAGTYTVTVKDAIGCEVTASFEIKKYDLAVSLTSNRSSVSKGETATLHAEATGGAEEYNYTWAAAETLKPIGKGDATVNPASTTTYKVTVKDGSGCTATGSVTVQVAEAAQAAQSAQAATESSMADVAKQAIRVSPNPSNGNFNVVLTRFNGKTDIKILDASGKEVNNKSLNVSSSQSLVPFNLTRLPKGMYIVNVISGDKTYQEKMVIR